MVLPGLISIDQRKDGAKGAAIARRGHAAVTCDRIGRAVFECMGMTEVERLPCILEGQRPDAAFIRADSERQDGGKRVGTGDGTECEHLFAPIIVLRVGAGDAPEIALSAEALQMGLKLLKRCLCRGRGIRTGRQTCRQNDPDERGFCGKPHAVRSIIMAFPE